MKLDFMEQLVRSGENFLSIKVCASQRTMKFTGDLRTKSLEASLSFAAATIVLEQADMPC